MVIVHYRQKAPKRSKDNKTKINEFVEASEIRLISETGEQLGVMKKHEALSIAQERKLDMVEVAPGSEPSVCRLMDYGRFKYQSSKKFHASRKHQKVVHLKEIQLRPKTEIHDQQFKIKNALKFLADGDKVKITVKFMGREIAHKELGEALIDKVVANIGDVAVVEQEKKFEGKSINVILAPAKK